MWIARCSRGDRHKNGCVDGYVWGYGMLTEMVVQMVDFFSGYVGVRMDGAELERLRGLFVNGFV